VDDVGASGRETETMRELAAAALLLLVLVVGALAPKVWAEDPAGAALAQRVSTRTPPCDCQGRRQSSEDRQGD